MYPEYRLQNLYCLCVKHVCTWPENCGDVSCLCAPDQKTVEMSHACVHLTRKLWRCLMPVCTWPENCGDVSCLHAPDWRGSSNTKYHSTWIREKTKTRSLTCPSCSRTWRSRTGWPLCRHRRAWAGTCPWWWRNFLSPTSPPSASASSMLPAHPNVSQLKFFPIILLSKLPLPLLGNLCCWHNRFSQLHYKQINHSPSSESVLLTQLL